MDEPLAVSTDQLERLKAAPPNRPAALLQLVSAARSWRSDMTIDHCAHLTPMGKVGSLTVFRRCGECSGCQLLAAVRLIDGVPGVGGDDA